MAWRNVPNIRAWRNGRNGRHRQHVPRFATGNVSRSAGVHSASTIWRSGRDGSLGHVPAAYDRRGRAWNVPLSNHETARRNVRAIRFSAGYRLVIRLPNTGRPDVVRTVPFRGSRRRLSAAAANLWRRHVPGPATGVLRRGPGLSALSPAAADRLHGRRVRYRRSLGRRSDAQRRFWNRQSLGRHPVAVPIRRIRTWRILAWHGSRIPDVSWWTVTDLSHDSAIHTAIHTANNSTIYASTGNTTPTSGAPAPAPASNLLTGSRTRNAKILPSIQGRGGHNKRVL